MNLSRRAWCRPGSLALVAVMLTIGCTSQRASDPVQRPAPPTATCPQRARLLFAGDVMQHLPQVEAARAAAGFDYAPSLAGLKTLTADADFSIANLETTLSPHPPYRGYPLFRSPAALAAAVHEAGFDAVVLANNHICDAGARGLTSTLSAVDAAGLRRTGAYASAADRTLHCPLRFTAGGLRFALLNYTYGTNGLPAGGGTLVAGIDTAAIRRDVEAIDRTRTDAVILFLHWGEEYARQATAGQRALQRFCRGLGVEIIVGSHPHVVQPILVERDGTGAVRSVCAFSLGNLVSNQRRRHTDGGLLLTLDALRTTPGGLLRFEVSYTPVWVLLPDYRILPARARDTAVLTAPQRAAFDRFLQDTRQLLAGSGARER